MRAPPPCTWGRYLCFQQTPRMAWDNSTITSPSPHQHTHSLSLSLSLALAHTLTLARARGRARARSLSFSPLHPPPLPSVSHSRALSLTRSAVLQAMVTTPYNWRKLVACCSAGLHSSSSRSASIALSRLLSLFFQRACMFSSLQHRGWWRCLHQLPVLC